MSVAFALVLPLNDHHITSRIDIPSIRIRPRGMANTRYKNIEVLQTRQQLFLARSDALVAHLIFHESYYQDHGPDCTNWITKTRCWHELGGVTSYYFPSNKSM